MQLFKMNIFNSIKTQVEKLLYTLCTLYVLLADLLLNIYRIVNAQQYLFFHQQNKSVFSSEITCAWEGLVYKEC